MIKVGKLKIVRLTGKDMDALRASCFARDNGLCVRCGMILDEHPFSPFQRNGYHMAHKRSKAHFGDILSNVQAKCSYCHLVIEHQNGGMEKIVPKKPY